MFIKQQQKNKCNKQITHSVWERGRAAGWSSGSLRQPQSPGGAATPTRVAGGVHTCAGFYLFFKTSFKEVVQWVLPTNGNNRTVGLRIKIIFWKSNPRLNQRKGLLFADCKCQQWWFWSFQRSGKSWLVGWQWWRCQIPLVRKRGRCTDMFKGNWSWRWPK